jgi:hypothetical protein
VDDEVERAGYEAVALLRLLARFAPEPLPLFLLNHADINNVLSLTRTERTARATTESGGLSSGSGP